MKNRTWSRRKGTVSTEKKSVATRAWAWLAMNSFLDGPVRCGLTPFFAKDLPHGGGSDAVSEAANLAVDAPVAPVRVLGVETQHEMAEFGRGGRSSRSRL